MTKTKRTCVYTILVGDYETLNEQPVASRSGIPFICLTDDPSLTSQTWKVVHVPTAFGMDPIRSQRILKICPHVVEPLAGFERSLYIDNSVILDATPEEIIERYATASGIGLPTHSFRNSVLDEFVEVARLGYDEQTRIFEQLNHYTTQGDPTLSERPYWTAIMLRDHFEPAVRNAMGRWASHVLRYSRRDQLSFNAALRDVGLVPDRWEIDNQSSWFHTWPHTPQRERFAGTRNPLASHMPPHVQIRLLQDQLAVAMRETEAAVRETEAARRDTEAARREIESSAAECERARAAAEDLQRRLAHERVEAARAIQLERDNQRLRDTLAQAVRDADATLAAIRASTSWRISAPLRQLKRWIA